MKILRIISYIILSILVIILLLGNIFYLQARKFIDKTNVMIELNEEEISRFNKQKNPDYNLAIYTDKNVYNKYEKIKIFAQIINKKNGSIPENSVIEAEFYNNGNKLSGLNGSERIKLIYNKDNKIWAGFWYPQNQDLSGNIDVNASGYPDKPEAPIIAKTSFYITEVTPKFTLNKGMAFMGIDSLERISKRNILSADSKEVDWNYIPEWLNFISADGILMLGGITKTFQEDITLDSPWDNDKINESIILAEKLKQKSKSIGIWMRTLKVEGIYAKKMGYRPALSIKDDKYVEDNSTISILDENRKKSISKLFTSFMDNDNISYVGISDMFLPPESGIELLDKFVQEFQINVPDDWSDMDFDSKFDYFAGKIADKQMFQNFVTWKQYVITEYIKDIINNSGHKKPIFYYMDYKDAIDNPDLISIVFNSGIDFVVLVFNTSYDNIMESLDRISNINKISKYYNRLVVSYYIDYQNIDMKDFEISAIDNYVNANLQLTKFGSLTLNANGIMINDLYKAMFGKRGPYSPYEWMLGIGETIYRFKDMNKVLPVNVDFSAPENVNYGEEFPIKIKLINTSAKPIGNFKIDVLPIHGKSVQKNSTISILPPGKETSLEIPLQIETNSSQFIRKKSFIGIRISWTENKDSATSTQGGYVLFRAINLNQEIAGINSSTNTVSNRTSGKTNSKLNK